jgi:hypothetical protein
MLIAASAARAEGEAFERWGQWYVSLGISGNSWYLSQQKIDDEDMFGYEGVPVTYQYYREATPEEIAAALEARATRIAARVAALAVDPAHQAAHQAATLKAHIERHGICQADNPALERVIWTWKPEASGMGTTTLSLNDTHIRVRLWYGGYGDFMTDSADYTLELNNLPAELREKLPLITAVTTETLRA